MNIGSYIFNTEENNFLHLFFMFKASVCSKMKYFNWNTTMFTVLVFQAILSDYKSSVDTFTTEL